MAYVGCLLIDDARYLNTPRLIADQNQTTVWRWDQVEPFGANPPDEDPDGNSVIFYMPFRFPGQYFDRETNLAYNMARDYDSNIGRYIESDPIGLDGGLNPFLYVKANPVAFQDPLGLKICRKCEDAAKIVRGVLENFNKSTYKVPCKMSCGSLGRGNGRTIIDIVINDNVYHDVNDFNYIAFTWTIAHEMRHCRQGWLDWIRSIPPTTDDDYWWNTFHNNLDHDAERDAYSVQEAVRRALDSGACCK